MFELTPAAAQEILAAARRSDAAELALRVAARRHSDGSIEYGMGFDEFRAEDEATEVAGVRVLVGAPSRALLAQTRLDYVEVEPGRFDFIFAPATAAEPEPKAKACGSGGCQSCSS